MEILVDTEGTDGYAGNPGSGIPWALGQNPPSEYNPSKMVIKMNIPIFTINQVS
jgi:hypothetical protein